MQSTVLHDWKVTSAGVTAPRDLSSGPRRGEAGSRARAMDGEVQSHTALSWDLSAAPLDPNLPSSRNVTPTSG